MHRGIHMKWRVNGDSAPFINNEKEFTQLFATGDACDLHLKSPKFGRCRFLVTMHDGQPTVIRTRFDGADTENAILEIPLEMGIIFSGTDRHPALWR
jgi:hypothetical protein